MKLGLDLTFNKLSMVKVFSYTYANNIASNKVLLKNGFKIEGKIKKFLKFSNSKRVNQLVFGINKKSKD